MGTDFMGQGENLRPQMRLLREEQAWKEKRLFWETAEKEIGGDFPGSSMKSGLFDRGTNIAAGGSV